jgi:hypothetical protein
MLDKSICSHDRFDKVVFFYIDGLPKYIASILQTQFPDEFISLSVNNPGLADSGPFYRNFLTGKMNYFYTGSLEKIDNLWIQMKTAGLNLLGTGFGYPIITMTDNKIFNDTIRTMNGFEWLNPEYKMTNIKQIQKNIPKEILDKQIRTASR